MSTRSMIAKQIAEDEYLAVYCHQDGYLSHNGALLLDCYNTPEKVDALLALGELSHLGKDMEAAPHEIADLKGMEGVTVAYCRDRGEAYRKPESYTLEELCSETPSVYQYVFTLEHAWKYHYGSKGTALSDVQKDLDAQYAYYGLERPESYYGRLNEGIAREMTEGQAESQGPALTNITIAYAEEKLAALNLYLSQKTLTVEEELGKALDALYTKNVPAGVREFIELRAGLTPASASTPKAKKPKPSAPSAVGEVPAAQEVSSHEQH